MNTKTKPTIKHARKVIDVVSCGLPKGKGVAVPGQMCIEAAVCYALGEPHSDNPSCVGEAVRAVKIALNDSDWSSNEARGKGMIRIAVAQLGSDQIDQKKFATTLAELTIRKIVPIALRAAASVHDKGIHKKALLDAALRCETEGTKNAAASAASAASYASYASYAYAASAASYAASYASYAYAAAAAASAASASRDEILTMMANLIEEALTICKSPGCKWLWLLNDITK